LPASASRPEVREVATASTATYNSVDAAAFPEDANPPAAATTRAYRDILASLWLTDPVPSWIPMGSSLTRLGRAPKHFLADPALAARLLRVDEVALARGSTRATVGPQAGPVLGRLFEAMVAQSLHTYAEASRFTLSHLRTSEGRHEVDFIVESGTGLAAVEVKLATTVDDRDRRHLAWLRAELPDRPLAAVAITTGAHAYTRPDGVHVVPAALLGP
jgi:predicted AAA+ superfamily ATPase